MASNPNIQGFNADAVRAGLRVAMSVGLPTDPADLPVFYMPAVTVTSSDVDQEGVPFVPGAVVSRTRTAVRGVQCAIEYHDGEGKLEAFGVIVPARVILTFLDEDYALVKGFDFVVIGANRYFYRRTENPKGLVTVGLFKVHCTAEEEV